jgi:hypothetical protein
MVDEVRKRINQITWCFTHQAKRDDFILLSLFSNEIFCNSRMFSMSLPFRTAYNLYQKSMSWLNMLTMLHIADIQKLLTSGLQFALILI